MPIRVLAVGSVYPPHHLGGYEVIWRGVMEHLRAEGHNARVLSTDYRRPDVGPEIGEDPDVHRELDWYWRDHEWRSLTPLHRLQLERHNAAVFDRHVREFAPDVITWWPMGGMSLGLIERARRAGIPALFFVLDPWLSYGPERDLWMRMWARLGPAAALAERFTGLPARVGWASAGRWVFCSDSIRTDTLASGVPIVDSIVLSPGVDSSYLAAPRELHPPPWRWRLLYVGRVVEQKGVETAIESLARLPSSAILRIVGPGDKPYRRKLERLASALGVEDRVRFDGPRAREELPAVYRAADVVVFPVTWSEPWGLVPLEAMALGRPVVATGRGGSGDYLEDRRNSLLFDAGDPGAMTRALMRLADDPELRERLRRGGYDTAAGHGEDQFNRRVQAEILAMSTVPRAFR